MTPPELEFAGRRESGNITLVMLGSVALAAVLLLGLGDISAYLLARTKAQTAADSAALAAVAELIPEIGIDPQAKADEYASANGAQLIECRCAMGSSVAEVVVSVPVRMSLKGLSGVTDVRAEAKAEVRRPAKEG